MAQALINHEIIPWARKRAQMDVAELARAAKASLSQVSNWEKGEAKPSFSKAIEIAKVLRIPFAYLFLTKPPSTGIEIPDLRTVGDRERHELSVDFRDVLDSALLKQQWFREHQRSIEESGFHLTLSDLGKTDREQAAEFIRGAMDWTDQTRKFCNGAAQYLTQLVTKAESLGILVMRSGVVGSNNRRKLSVSEFRGFALADDVAPAIFINSNDAKTAQVFTFAHELVHVWLGRSGVSNPEGVATTQNAAPIELRCNEIAASLVAPKREMSEIWGAKRDAAAVATHFRVSQIVILRRALELRLIESDEFVARVGTLGQRAAVRKGEGGNFNTTLPARNSPLFTRTILSDVRRGAVGFRDAARLLSIKPGTVRKLASGREAS